MNKTLQAIIKSRRDLSPYLFHFTKGAKALATLIKIISEQKLKDVNGKGVVCFTEAPLTSMSELFDIFGKYPRPMYAPYGIAIERNMLFELGARPVIYGKEEEREQLNEDKRWRFEPFNPATQDFTWLREWRIQDDVILDPEKIIIITKTEAEIYTHFDDIDVEIDGDWADGQWNDQSYAYGTRNWKSVSIESLKAFSMLDDHQVKDIINDQNIGDPYGL